MKVFLSWSGEVSRQIAQVLHDDIQLILPAIEPFLSSVDIDPGEQWLNKIGQELEKCNFGIICLTHQNLYSQWIAFEAGALSKFVATSRVATVLFGINYNDVQGPLSIFQYTLFSQEGFQQLIFSINKATPQEARRKEEHLGPLFPVLWGRIEPKISKILQNADASVSKPVIDNSDVPTMVSELLLLVKQQIDLFSTPEKFIAPIITQLENRIEERINTIIVNNSQNALNKSFLKPSLKSRLKSDKS